MQKTRLGISVGLLGAMVYFTCLFSGYIMALTMTGYILLCEENAWLKKTAVKAVILSMLLSFLSFGVDLFPDVINFINSICAVFGGYFSIPVVNSIVNVLLYGLSLVKTVLFLLLGVKALNQRSVSVPIVDKLISKYM